jgi:citronellol/citronellal dehydrogenase
MGDLKGKTVFVTGGSRGIGLAIALRCAADGANITIAAKTVEPHPKLEGTIYTALEEIKAAGGQGLACQVDVRDENSVSEAVAQTVDTFGGIDILINNASAISLTPTLQTQMKRYDLMQDVNTRGTFMVSKACIPHLLKSDNPHVLNLSPPLNMEEKWFGPHVAYTIAKFGMSMCVLGMAQEFKKEGVAFNALWPRTTIATAAVRNLLGGEEVIKGSRSPEIMADAAYIIFNKKASENSGNFYVDDEVLASVGITDLSKYAITPGATLFPDFFVDPV